MGKKIVAVLLIDGKTLFSDIFTRARDRTPLKNQNDKLPANHKSAFSRLYYPVR